MRPLLVTRLDEVRRLRGACYVDGVNSFVEWREHVQRRRP